MSNSNILDSDTYVFRDLSRGKPVGNMFQRICCADRRQDGGTESVPEKSSRSVYCKRCGYTWSSIVENPKRCPNCGSFQWNSAKVSYRCEVCGHIWDSRKDGLPKKCPQCKSVKWNVPRTEQVRMNPDGTVLVEDIELHLRRGSSISMSEVLKAAMETSVPMFGIMMDIKKHGGTVVP